MLPPDPDEPFVDLPNGYMIPESPFLPLFRAVDIMEAERTTPKFDWRLVDIVTDRNSLRKLFAWGDGSHEAFRIDLQLAGDFTILFNRWKANPAGDAWSYGWGDSFERATTEPARGCERTLLAGHHRIVNYVRPSESFTSEEACSS